MISHPFPYRIIRSSRKTLAIQVSVSGQVTVRAPHTMPDSTIHRFLSQKESWILKHLSHAASRPAQPPKENPPLSEFRRSYYMESARKIFKRKTAAYARKMAMTSRYRTMRTTLSAMCLIQSMTTANIPRSGYLNVAKTMCRISI